VRAFCFGRRVCLLSVCPASDLGNYARYARNFVALIGNWGRRARIMPMTSDFAPEVAKINSPNEAPNSKIVQNSVRAYCLALLSDAACCTKNCTVFKTVCKDDRGCITALKQQYLKCDFTYKHIARVSVLTNKYYQRFDICCFTVQL